MSKAKLQAAIFSEISPAKSSSLFPKGLQDSPRIPELKEVIYSPLKDDQYLSNIYFSLHKKIGHCAMITGQHERMKTVEFFIKEGFKCLLRLGLAHSDSNYFSSEGGAIPYVILEKDNMIVGVGREVMFIHESTKENIKLIEKFHKSISAKIRPPSQISLLLSEYGDLCLKDFETKPLEINFDLYNEGFKEDYDCIVDFLNNDDSGIVLLTGNAGAGKSSLIKTLLKTVKKKFVYIPAEMVGQLASPTFLSFALENLKESILIVEDGDSIVLRNGLERNPATTMLLNIGDGVLGDLLKCKIILTANLEGTADGIDEAIVRKGRLKRKVEFKKLAKERCQIWLDKNKISHTVTEDLSLAELFHLKEDNGYKKKESRSMNLFGQ